MQIASREASKAAGASTLGQAMIDGLNLPLAALRASLESLADELDDEDPRTPTVAGALREVSKVGRTVRELADYSNEPTPMPLRCTVEEIVYSARHRLPLAQRDRVLVARVEKPHTLTVDGPLLAQCLFRLIENAVEAGSGWVLVNVRNEGDSTEFVTLNRDPGEEFDWEWAQTPFQTDKPEHIGLGLALARRDIELMGGTLGLSRTPRGEAVAVVRIPNNPEAAR